MEPTAAAIGFLDDTFTAFDQDEDDALSPGELEHMFATAPELPWHQQPPLHVDTTQVRQLDLLWGFFSRENTVAPLSVSALAPANASACGHHPGERSQVTVRPCPRLQEWSSGRLALDARSM